MERKVVTIQHVDGLEPIEGADRVVKGVMGWDVVKNAAPRAPRAGRVLRAARSPHRAHGVHGGGRRGRAVRARARSLPRARRRTIESDWQRARALLAAIVEREAPRTTTIPREADDISAQYRISPEQLTPTVWVPVAESGVRLTIRYLCPPRERRGSADRLWREILVDFAKEPTLAFAYPTERLVDNRLDGRSPAERLPAAWHAEAPAKAGA